MSAINFSKNQPLPFMVKADDAMLEMTNGTSGQSLTYQIFILIIIQPLFWDYSCLVGYTTIDLLFCRGMFTH
ncbi:hypothetical protein [Paenibacillus sp. B1-33]|uniref:hypothetical protein n=1 Tax=unclassified Paenibacillus TaxID=185978 RepID=UPI003D2C4B45